MDARIKDLLKPEILNTVNGLELIARVIVEGFMSGSNTSQTIGIGQEFSQYRSYQPGDDLRQLDWKMFGRTERYYIKQAEVETNITVKFMLDASASMDYRENGLSKLQLAKILIAALAYLARRQSDTFGLYVINNDQVQYIEPRFEQQQFHRLLYTLVQTQATSTWTKAGSNDHLYNHHGKELIVFITDLYDDQRDLQQFINRIKTTRNEVVVLHLMGEQELLLNYEGAFTFQDIETGERVKVNTREQQALYKQKITDWLQQCRSWMLEKQIGYQLITMNTPAEQALYAFLKARKHVGR